ncbi:hypothetical protein [Zooshikella sp. RANM57]|uniref:hypothetical protein n=1 Tax=Zooshikella sp. RANM57 TaxID=3425863 RepID=UPI003D6F6230
MTETVTIKVRKSCIEGLNEAYFGENISIDVGVEEFALKLSTDVKEHWQDVTGCKFECRRTDKDGHLSYSEIVHLLGLGVMKATELDASNPHLKTSLENANE